MKIFINRKLRRNPWGGGIHFATGFADYLTTLGHQVTTQYDDDVDIILMIDPRDDDGFGDINQLIQYKNFLKLKNRNVKVIHRINDSDVARGTNFLVDLNIKSNLKIADKTVFISQWLKTHYEERGFLKPSIVIKNGCNHEWFYPSNVQKCVEQISVVTHHWSDNYNKGFDVYIELDKQLQFIKDVKFTYIGRYYKDYKPTFTNIIPPLYGIELGEELRKHDVYLTAAKWEACGMHHIEASSCGLPVVFHKDGGGINEICSKHGAQLNDIKEVINTIKFVYKNKDSLISKIDYNSMNSNNVNKSYLDVIISSLS
jgi:glycosyltransferase involved in cell wall biosynthesis